MILDLFKYILDTPLLFEEAYVSIDPSFLLRIKLQVKREYKTLKTFGLRVPDINYRSLLYIFRKAQSYSMKNLLNITTALLINNEELLNNIRAFRVNGGARRARIILPRFLKIDEKFIEGYALYIAEGDTGLSGKTKPRKLRFTNSNIRVIKLFIRWLNSYFPHSNFYVSIILPIGQQLSNNNIIAKQKYLELNTSQIKLRKGYYNKQIKYKVCYDRAFIIDLILSLDQLVKKVSFNNQKLAIAYIRGMMMGEGTAYLNKSRYVRIEMKNEREIKYICTLLHLLKYKCAPSLRTKRIGMWSIYIGAKQLSKFYKEIGFGVHQERQEILKKAVNKKLRVNQYC